MKLNKSQIVSLAIVIVSFLIGLYFYPQLPGQMATHWDLQGHVNGYMSKFGGVFFLPLLLAGLVIVFLAIPLIDPLKANIAQFRKYYDGFIVVFSLFMLLIHVHIILWNLGIKVSPNRFLPVALGGLFYYIGILFEHARPNWFIGIRTPWTLSSESVWTKTHQIGAKLFKITGIIVALGMLFEKYGFYFIVVPVLLVAIYLVVYSYFEYRKLAKTQP